MGSAFAVAASLLSATAAHADVAYIDGNEVWVSTLDGSQKVRLSSGENDWRDVAVSDQGYVVGVRLETNKIANLSTFTVWNQQGSRIRSGPLTSLSNGGSNAHPLNLQITPDGGLLVYGFSNYVYNYPVGTLITGFHLLPTSTVVAPYPNPYYTTAAKWPALIGERVVGATGSSTLGVQEAGSTGSPNFTPWPGIDVGGVGTIDGLDVNDSGTKVAINVDLPYPSTDEKLIVFPAPGLGQAPTALPNPIVPGDVGDCFVPATGNTADPSLSADGTRLAWSDAGGVKVAGVPLVVPTDGVQNLCTMSSPAVTISATGKYPALGPVSVAAIKAGQQGSGGGGGGGGGGAAQPTAPVLGSLSGLKLAKLGSKKGASLTVTAGAGGKVTVQLTYKPKGKKAIVVAQGSKNLAAGATGKIKVKLTAKGKKSRKKLKGKTVSVILTSGSSVTTRTVKLR